MFHSTSSTRSRTFRHLVAALHVLTTKLTTCVNNKVATVNKKDVILVSLLLTLKIFYVLS